jgi:GxxExxY protein
MLYQETTDKIIKAFYDVYNTLGYGFPKKVYENSMYIELSALGLKCKKPQFKRKIYTQKNNQRGSAQSA